MIGTLIAIGIGVYVKGIVENEIENSYDKGYKEGYNNGYRKGHTDGYHSALVDWVLCDEKEEKKTDNYKEVN